MLWTQNRNSIHPSIHLYFIYLSIISIWYRHTDTDTHTLSQYMEFYKEYGICIIAVLMCSSSEYRVKNWQSQYMQHSTTRNFLLKFHTAWSFLHINMKSNQSIYTTIMLAQNFSIWAYLRRQQNIPVLSIFFWTAWFFCFIILIFFP